jgi:glycosyltransferase involved in cell wall biosynthesis
MTPIKIVQLIPSSNIGGAETMLLGLLDRINREIFKVIICVIEGGPFAEEARSKGFDVIQLPLYRNKRDIRFLMMLLGTLARLKPDIIHSHIFILNLFASLAGRIRGIPVISTFHSNHNLETLGERIALKIIYHFSKSIVNVSQHQVKHFAFPLNSGKVKVIRNGVRVVPRSDFNEAELSRFRREDLGIISDDQIITYVGNFRSVKGHIFLLQAMQMVLKEWADAQLLLVGDGYLKNEIEKMSNQYGIREKVHFLGFRKDVMRLLAVSDMFASPSLDETTSIAILEAMSMGVPIVATDVGGNSELLDDHTGLLVPAMNPRALAEGILFLLVNKDLGLRLGRNAMDRVKENFGSEFMAKEYENLYLNLSNTRRLKIGS